MTNTNIKSTYKKPPEIPADATKDIPLGNNDPSQTPQLVTPEQKHKWNVESLKDNMAYAIILICIAALGIIAILMTKYYILQPQSLHNGSDIIGSVTDTLKAVLMTTLGFLFGKQSL